MRENEACERLVAKVLDRSPIVKLMINALEDNGCKFIPWKHLACEPCSAAVDGGRIVISL